MAVNRKLTKKIISNKHANDILLKKFSQLAKTKDPVDNETLWEVYNSVFYYIPKAGKESHRDIIDQSYKHIYAQRNKQLSTTIKHLGSSIFTEWMPSSIAILGATLNLNPS